MDVKELKDGRVAVYLTREEAEDVLAEAATTWFAPARAMARLLRALLHWQRARELGAVSDTRRR